MIPTKSPTSTGPGSGRPEETAAATAAVGNGVKPDTNAAADGSTRTVLRKGYAKKLKVSGC